MKNFTYFLLSLVLAACGHGAPGPDVGSSSGFGSGSSGSVEGSGHVEVTSAIPGSTGEPLASSSGSEESDGSTTDGPDTSSGGAVCVTTPVNPSKVDPEEFLCLCGGVVSDPAECMECDAIPCWPTDCWTIDEQCVCHGYPAVDEFCEGGSTGEGSSTG